MRFKNAEIRIVNTKNRYLRMQFGVCCVGRKYAQCKHGLRAWVILGKGNLRGREPIAKSCDKSEE